MEIAPYKVGFPLGLFFGLWGVILWVGYGMGLLTNYPSAYHANIMIGGFLFSFAGGFLMTAIPQFTGTKPASRLEVTALPVFLIGFICSVVINNLLASHLFLLGYLLFLVFFGATRFRRRKYAPPSSFVFVGIGLATGIFGMLFTTLDDVQGIASILGSVGRLMYLQGVMLCLVLGVGSRLAPALMGLTKKSLLKIKPSPEQMANRPDYPSISFMLELAQVLGSKVTLFHHLSPIIDPIFQSAMAPFGGVWMPYREKMHALQERKQNLLDSWAKKARENNVEIQTFLDTGNTDTAETIRTYSRKHNIGLITMGTQSGTIATAIFGAITRNVVRQAECPVWLLRRH